MQGANKGVKRIAAVRRKVSDAAVYASFLYTLFLMTSKASLVSGGKESC